LTNDVDAVNRSSVPHYATVWVADDVHFRAPEGYTIEAVYNAPNGSTAVDVERVDA